MMKTIDTNSDIFIKLEEFAGFCRANAGEEGEGTKELREAFEMYDLNNNGLISASELQQILTRLGESCTVEDCVKMIKSVDSDGDGCANFDEFKKMMMAGGGEGASDGVGSVAI
ncbi:putative EF-hand domain pair protein CML [Helianthus anomalus]